MSRGQTVEQWAETIWRKVQVSSPVRRWAERHILEEWLNLEPDVAAASSVKLAAAADVVGLRKEVSDRGTWYADLDNVSLTPSQQLWRKRQADRELREAAGSEASVKTEPTPAWAHPGTTPKPETVLVVGLGPSKHSLVDLQTGHEPPDWSVDEVWGINAGANWFCGRVAWDLLWVMDYLDGEAAKFPRYGQQLRAWAEERPGRRPIMTSKAGTFDDVATELPLAELWRSVHKVADAPPYFRNSVPYVLAYAWWIGVKRIYLWGCDYNHPQLGNHREPDRANAEYWVGWCRAQGVQVVLPNTSTLLCTNEPTELYGYPPGAERAVTVDGGEVTL